jgi:hypothetical protein
MGRVKGTLAVHILGGIYTSKGFFSKNTYEATLTLLALANFGIAPQIRQILLGLHCQGIQDKYGHCVQPYLHWRSLYWTQRQNARASDTWQSLLHLPWPPWALQHDTKENHSCLCHAAQYSQGKQGVTILKRDITLANLANVHKPYVARIFVAKLSPL